MKKAAVIALSLLLVLPLGACGGKDKEDTAQSASTESTATEADRAVTTSAAEEADETGKTSEAEVSAKAETSAAGTNATETAPAGTNATETAPAGTNATGTDPAGTNTTAEEVVLPYIDDKDAEDGTLVGEAFHKTGHSDQDVKTGEKEEENEIEVQDVPETPDGMYRLTRLQDGDVILEEEDIRKREAASGTMYIQFAADSTLKADLFGEQADGYWNEDNETVILGGSVMTYALDRKYVTLKDDGMTMRFSQVATSEQMKAEAQEEKEKAQLEAAEEALYSDTYEETAEDGALQENAAGVNGTTLDEAAAETGLTEEEEGPKYEISDETALDTTVVYNGTEGVIYWQNYVTVEITGYEPFAAEGFKIKVHCENDNYDDVHLTVNECSVNGYMFDPCWRVIIPALDNIDSEIVFPTDKIREYGLTSMDEIMFEFRQNYTYDWTEYAVARQYKEIYPTERDYNEEIKVPERTKTTQERTIVDNDKFSFIVLYSEDVPDVGYVLHAYLENKTGVNQMFYWDDVKVNGILTDPFWSEELLGGTRMYSDIVFPEEALSQNGISMVTGVEFVLGIFDNSNWLSYDMYSETHKYRP